MHFNKFLGVSMAFAFTADSYGTSTIAVANFDQGGGNDLALTDTSGSLVTSGFAALYEFNTNGQPAPPSTASALQANGIAGQLGLIAINPGNSPDAGALFAGFSFNDTGASDGADLFFVLGNGTGVGDSTGLALVDIDGHVPVMNSPFFPQDLGQYDLVSTSDVLIGEVGNIVIADWTNITGNASYNTNSLRLSAVPEPSVSLIAGLGFLLLTGRRKRS